MSQVEATIIWVDNKSAISMAKNPVFHDRTKYIKMKYHALRKVEVNKEVKLNYYKYEVQIADILTKSLPKRKFKVLKKRLGVLKKNLEGC